MKSFWIVIVEFVVTAAIVMAGLANKRILFIDGVKSAAITLGVIGILFCLLSVGKFIAHPSNPMTIIGVLLGAAASVIVLGLIFKWKLPLVTSPSMALYILAVMIVVKGIIARFGHLLVK